VFNDGGVLFITSFLCSQTSMNAELLELTTVQEQQLVPILLEVLLVDATLDTQGME